MLFFLIHNKIKICKVKTQFNFFMSQFNFFISQFHRSTPRNICSPWGWVVGGAFGGLMHQSEVFFYFEINLRNCEKITAALFSSKDLYYFLMMNLNFVTMIEGFCDDKRVMRRLGTTAGPYEVM